LKKVFIVHGHDHDSKNELESFLWRVGLEPIILHEQAKRGRTILEQFEKYAADVGFAFILLTPDDFGGENQNKDIKPRARQNVILEMGYFWGMLGRERICCLSKGEVDPPSDMHGILLLKYNSSVEEQFYNIIRELRTANYNVEG
jgi:predicted nucleotide-binding protein